MGTSRSRGEVPPLAGRAIRRLPRPLQRPAELIVRTATDAVDDRIVGLAAEVAFFAILALPPLLLTVVATLGFLPGDQSGQFVNALIRVARRVFTPDTVDSVIGPTVQALIDTPRRDVVSIGFAISLVSSSRAVRVVLTAVAIAYDLEGFRPNWKQRIWALALTLGLFVVVPVVIPLLLAGPDLGRALAASDLVPTALAELWPLVYWVGVGTFAVLAVAVIYNLAAPAWTPFRRDLPGAVVAVAICVASSAGLRIYTRNAIAGSDIYEFLAGPLALLVWLYLLAFGVLLGGELNAELERLYPSPEQQSVPPSQRLRRVWATSSVGERTAGLRDRFVATTPLDRVDERTRGTVDDERDEELDEELVDEAPPG